MKRIVIITFFLVIFAGISFAQDQPLPINDCSSSRVEVKVDNSNCIKPIVWGTKDDGFPNKMKIKGVVTKVTLVQISCGVLCHFGTAEIKLSERPKGYNSDFIYVTVLCFSGKKEDYLNRSIEQNVLKTDKDGFKKYYCGSIYNFIDSNGLPFYDLLDDKNRINGRLKFK
jgi:hypothetical protein